MEEAARSKGLDGSDSVSALEERRSASQSIVLTNCEAQGSCTGEENMLNTSTKMAGMPSDMLGVLLHCFLRARHVAVTAIQIKCRALLCIVFLAWSSGYAELSEAHEKVKGELQQEQHWHERCVTLESEIKEQQEKAMVGGSFAGCKLARRIFLLS